LEAHLGILGQRRSASPAKYKNASRCNTFGPFFLIWSLVMKKFLFITLVVVGAANFCSSQAAARNPLAGGAFGTSPIGPVGGGAFALPPNPFPACGWGQTPNSGLPFKPFLPDCGWGGPSDFSWRLQPYIPRCGGPSEIRECRPLIPTITVCYPRPTQPTPIDCETPPQQDPPVITYPNPIPTASVTTPPPSPTWQQQYGKHRKPSVPSQSQSAY
jgi:hypothetical protein